MAINRYMVMRHGASESNIMGVVQGVVDVPLATLGKEQAMAAGLALQGKGITKVYTSPLQRALETALLVAQELQVEVSIVDGFRARDLGEWAGKPRQEIKEMWADLAHPFRKDPDFAPPGGESLRSVDERLFQAVDRILEGPEKELPLMVMHLIGTGALIGRVQQERPGLPNAGVWEIISTPPGAREVFAPDGPALGGDE